jgi:hypothetical protein
MNITAEQYNEKARRNFETIEDELSELADHYLWLNTNHSKEYKDFWNHAKEITELFKTLKPIKKEDREKLWSDFGSQCEEMRRKQTQDNDNLKIKSNEFKDRIMRELKDADIGYKYEFDSPSIEAMKRLGSHLKEAGALLSLYKNEMTFEHKQECWERIEGIQKEHNAWWESLTGHRSQSRENFKDKIRANIDKNRESLKKAEEALERCKARQEDIQEKIRNAWNDNFIEMAEGWLSEEEAKETSIENNIQRIEDWISEDEEKLR